MLLWSQEQIANRLRKEKNSIRVSTCTIYRALASGLLPPGLRKVLRIKGRIRFGGHKKSPCGPLDIEALPMLRVVLLLCNLSFDGKPDELKRFMSGLERGKRWR